MINNNATNARTRPTAPTKAQKTNARPEKKTTKYFSPAEQTRMMEALTTYFEINKCAGTYALITTDEANLLTDIEKKNIMLTERTIVRFDDVKCQCSSSVYEHINKLEIENKQLQKQVDELENKFLKGFTSEHLQRIKGYNINYLKYAKLEDENKLKKQIINYLITGDLLSRKNFSSECDFNCAFEKEYNFVKEQATKELEEKQ